MAQGIIDNLALFLRQKIGVSRQSGICRLNDAQRFDFLLAQFALVHVLFGRTVAFLQHADHVLVGQTVAGFDHD